MPALRAVVVTVDGEVSDPARGPQGEVARRRRDILDERQRLAVLHRTAAQAARTHILCNLTGKETGERIRVKVKEGRGSGRGGCLPSVHFKHLLHALWRQRVEVASVECLLLTAYCGVRSWGRRGC